MNEANRRSSDRQPSSEDDDSHDDTAARRTSERRPVGVEETDADRTDSGDEDLRPDSFPDLAERRERLMESLKQKVDAVMGLRRLVDSLEEADKEGLKSGEGAIRDYLIGLHAGRPDQNRAAARIQAIAREMQILRTRCDVGVEGKGTDSDASSDGEDVESSDRQRIEDLQREYFRLVSDPEIGFLMMMDRTVASLASKKRFVDAFRGDPQGAIQYFSDLGVYPLDPADVERVEMGAFDISFVLSRPDGWLLEEDADGVHLAQTCFNLVLSEGALGGSEPFDEYLRHERTHNYLDGALGYERSPVATKLVGLIADLDRRVREGDSPTEVWTEIGPQAEILAAELGPRELLDQLDNELLAHLENMEPILRNGQWLPSFVRSAMDSRDLEDMVDSSLVGSMSTAGEMFSQYRHALQSVARLTGDGQLGRSIGAKAGQLTRGLLKSIDSLREALLLTDRLGDGAGEVFHALAVVLRPSQYRHMRQYLEAHFGPEQVRLAMKSMEAAEKLGTLDGFRSACRLALNGELHPLDLESLRQRFEDYLLRRVLPPVDLTVSAGSDLPVLERLRQTSAGVDALSGKIGLDRKSVDLVGELAEREVIGQAVRRSVSDGDGERLKALHEELEANHRSALIECLAEQLKPSVEYEDYLYNRVGRALSEHPLWPSIGEVGLEKEVVDGVERLFMGGKGGV
ncbi:hypothetical protein COY93_04830 [Candidatus Uhrbacteria bacterium CG_4_10_14_0_8_um_filter_58_22]|uniref:Uncharacterized protein n=1 Tax=Candidatus Uhrbacteria bacterium CG_4_10_14_0_8_um_filter_58_22 TaxID=1975029 RepID=A0A2M7Q8P2_9BACT|nr:MAG: hypothetical protein COY93_04830 [Candidatus Uhrbacteria bacterium CG_4_10_14_0_8_um_filter_58_22]